jgi:diaminopimelate decarboxylase
VALTQDAARADPGCTPTGPPVLPARMSERTRVALTEQAALLRELSAGIGGPFHVLVAEQFDANLDAFLDAAREKGVPLRVYYAKKANKAATWVRRCAELGVGVDVSSSGELREALGHGVRGGHLVVTGPAKSDELQRLALLHGALIAVDAPDEFARLIDLARALTAAPHPARILLRARPSDMQVSRFGMTDAELDDIVSRCTRLTDLIRLEGFSVHLGGYDPEPRAAEAARLARRCVDTRASGLEPTAVSIGGGFPVDYVDGGAWARFTDDPAHFHAGRRFDGFYPYHSPRPGPEALRSVLRSPATPGDPTVADLFRDAGLALLIEPGRALLDQAGFTVFRIQGVKGRDGYAILTVDGTSMSLSEQWFGSEFLPDPVLLSARPDESGGRPHQACVGGASCLESDMLTWRRVVLPRRPEAGDLLVYPNTAGYQMDSNESPFHELPLPPKVVLGPRGALNRWRFDRAAF